MHGVALSRNQQNAPRWIRNVGLEVRFSTKGPGHQGVRALQI